MKIYVSPSTEELTPGTAAFKARVAQQRPLVKERLVAVPEAVNMIQKPAQTAEKLFI